MQERVPKKGIKAKYSLRLEEFHEKKNISLYSETAPRNVLEKVYEEVRWLRTWNIFVRFEKLRTSQRVSVHNTHTRAHNIQDSLIQEFTLEKKGTVTARGALVSIFVLWAPMEQGGMYYLNFHSVSRY